MSEETGRTVILHMLLTAAAIGGTLYFSVPAACIVFVFSLIVLLLHLRNQSRMRRGLVHLCEEIDKVLRNADHIVLEDFSEGEISLLSSEIRKMTIRLREQNAALKQEQQFMKESLEDISHQLRTPLTSMVLLVNMIGEPSKASQQREYLRELSSLLSHMQWLIETLLTLSRVEAGAVQFRKTSISCRELLAAAIEPISVALELKDITVNVNFKGDPVFEGDERYCTEALLNLLKNCMEHTPEGGTITIEAEENPICTMILVTDSGNGIAAKDLPHIFERFYRSSDFAKNGYGIGLAFARKVIAAQNGSIQVRNAEPHGAQFDLRFYKTIV